MARPGIPWNPNIDDIVDALVETRGNVMQTAKKLDVHRESIYELLRNNADLKKKLDEIRSNSYECDLDMAEQVVKYTMSMAKMNPRLAYDASKFVLTRKGLKRGWGSVVDEDDVKKGSVVNIIQYNDPPSVTEVVSDDNSTTHI